MFRSSLLRMLAVVFICLSSLGVNPAAAQNSGDNYLAMTAARTCDDNSVIIRWETVNAVSLRFSLSNTSDNWTSGWVAIGDIASKTHTEPVDHNYDKVVLEATFADGTSVQRDANVGTCVDDIGMVPAPDAAPGGGVVQGPVTVTGTVVDTNGAPLVGVDVCLEITVYDGRERFNDCVLTNASGLYVFTGVPARDQWMIWGLNPTVTGYWPVDSTESIVGDIVTVDFVYEPVMKVTITGKITDQAGDPVENAIVCAFFMQTSCVQTRSDGGYTITDVSTNGPGIVIATDQSEQFSGRLSITPSFEGETITADIVLDPAVRQTISGQVTDDAGTPISGAVVRLRSSLGFNWMFTDSMGNYAFTDMPAVGFTLTADYDTESVDTFYIPFKTTILSTESAVDTPIVLDRIPGGRVTGMIVDQNGNPLDGAILDCGVCGKGSGDGSPSPADYGRADATGRFVWGVTEPVPAGLYQPAVWTESCSAQIGPWPYVLATVSHAGLNDIGTIRVNCETYTAVIEPPTVVPGPGEDERTFAISGTVTDDAGAPLVGAAVCVRTFGTGLTPSCVSSNRDGYYVIENVPDSEGYIWAELDLYGHDSTQFSFPGENITFNPVLQASPFFTLSGQVTQEDGTPVSGIRVCSSWGVGVDGRNCVSADAGGFYSFTTRTDKPYTVLSSGDRNWALIHDSFENYPDPRWGNVVFITEVSDVVVNLTAIPFSPEEPSEPTATLVGLLVDSRGYPITDFRVCEIYDEATKAGGRDCITSSGDSNKFMWTSETGYFGDVRVHVQGCPVTFVGTFWEGLTPGVHDLGTFVVDCEAGVAPITTSVVSGVVTYLDGSPAAGVTVSLTSEVAASELFALATSGNTATTEADGTYAFSDVIDGSYTISATAGSGLGDKQQITVAGIDVTANLVLRYSNVSIAGKVTDEDGQPIAGARVCLNEACLMSAESGSYTFGADKGTIGEHILSVGAEGFVSKSLPITILGDVSNIDVNFQLIAGTGNEAPTESPTVIPSETPTDEASGTSTPTSTAPVTPDSSGTASPDNSDGDKVTSLPTTGTGTMNGTMGIAALLAIAASSLLLAGGLAVRQRRG